MHIKTFMTMGNNLNRLPAVGAALLATLSAADSGAEVASLEGLSSTERLEVARSGFVLEQPHSQIYVSAEEGGHKVVILMDQGGYQPKPPTDCHNDMWDDEPKIICSVDGVQLSETFLSNVAAQKPISPKDFYGEMSGQIDGFPAAGGWSDLESNRVGLENDGVFEAYSLSDEPKINQAMIEVYAEVVENTGAIGDETIPSFGPSVINAQAVYDYSNSLQGNPDCFELDGEPFEECLDHEDKLMDAVLDGYDVVEAALEREEAALDKEIAALEESIASREAENKALEREEAALDKAIEAQKKRIAEKDHKIAVLEALISNSQ